MRFMISGAIVVFSFAQSAWAQTSSPLPKAAGEATVAMGRPLDLSSHAVVLARPLRQESTVELAVEPITAVNHRFGQDGLVGEAGYLCGIGGIGPDADALRGGPASAFGRSSTFLGASLGYAFK
jgi:hypothetical protein